MRDIFSLGISLQDYFFPEITHSPHPPPPPKSKNGWPLILFVISIVVIVISSEDEDPGAEGGDEYEEGQESDSDIDEDDLWSCPHCNLKNHPLSRQCARCWVERHEWLPHLKRCV